MQIFCMRTHQLWRMIRIEDEDQACRAIVIQDGMNGSLRVRQCDGG